MPNYDWKDFERSGEDAVRQGLANGGYNRGRTQSANAWLAHLESTRAEEARVVDVSLTKDSNTLAREANDFAKEANSFARASNALAAEANALTKRNNLTAVAAAIIAAIAMVVSLVAIFKK
jgi:hypothetical protein